jgi:hypothetical protein
LLGAFVHWHVSMMASERSQFSEDERGQSLSDASVPAQDTSS